MGHEDHAMRPASAPPDISEDLLLVGSFLCNLTHYLALPLPQRRLIAARIGRGIEKMLLSDGPHAPIRAFEHAAIEQLRATRQLSAARATKGRAL